MLRREVYYRPHGYEIVTRAGWRVTGKKLIRRTPRALSALGFNKSVKLGIRQLFR